MRFMEWIQLTGKILHGHNYLWSVVKKSSVSRTRKFTYFQILCYALERWIRIQHQILFGKNSWVGSKIHHNTETLERIDGEPMEFEWNIFLGFTTLQLSYKVQEFMSKMSIQPEDFTGRKKLDKINDGHWVLLLLHGGLGQGSWWTPYSYESHHGDEPSTDRTG